MEPNDKPSLRSSVTGSGKQECCSRAKATNIIWHGELGSADPPPASILTAFGADVIITAVKDLQINTPKPQIFASAKTQKHLREPGSRSTMAKASTSVDPWLAEDPWGGYAKTTTGPNSSKTHREVLQEHLREDILTGDQGREGQETGGHEC